MYKRSKGRQGLNGKGQGDIMDAERETSETGDKGVEEDGNRGRGERKRRWGQVARYGQGYILIAKQKNCETEEKLTRDNCMDDVQRTRDSGKRTTKGEE
jgi:hypothetical protein